jgi:two-component system, LytTR family, response regulator AlgR
MNQPIRILIVDDESPARARMRELLSDCAEEVPNEVVGEAASGMQALGLLPDCNADLALADIHMPGMTGLEFARHLQGLESPPKVVFVTAHDQHAIEAFEVNALDYLLKPVRAARLAAALRKAASAPVQAREQLANADPGPRRFFSSVERGRVNLVPVEEVIYLKAELKYVTLKTREREFLIEESLSQIEEEMGPRFVRVHRNCLVAADRIRGAEKQRGASGDAESETGQWSVLLEGVTEAVPVSRRQWSVVKGLVKP